MQAQNKDHKLLEDGLTFVKDSIELVQEEAKPHQLKIAIILFSIGLELIIKDCLFKEHWTLVFSDPNSASLRNWESGDFQSVGFKTSLDRLAKVSGRKIVQESGWRSIRNKRNRLEHFGVVDHPESMKASSAKALNSLFSFVDQFIGRDKLSAKEKSLLLEIKVVSAGFEKFVTKRLAELEPDLNRNATIECLNCSLETAIVDAGLRCLFCDNKLTAFEAARDYSTEDNRIWDCPFCDGSDTLLESFDIFCFSCAARKEQFQRCLRCEAPILGTRQWCQPCQDNLEEHG
jgi:hypothetical protein